MRVTTATRSHQQLPIRVPAATQTATEGREQEIIDSLSCGTGERLMYAAGGVAVLGATLFTAGLAATRFQWEIHGLLGGALGGIAGIAVGSALVAPLCVGMTVKEDGVKTQSFIDGAGLSIIFGGGVGGFTGGLLGLAGGNPVATATAGVLTMATGIGIMAALTE